MKILFLGAYNDSDIVLAPIKVGKELFKSLSFHKINIVYLCYFDDGSKYSRFQKIFSFKKINERVFRSGIFPLLLFVIKYKPDIIQIVTPDAFYLPLILVKKVLKFRVAYLSHSIISYSLKNFLSISCYQKIRLRIIEKYVLKYSDIIEILSRVEARFLTRFLNIKKEKIKVVDNGIIPSGVKKEYSDSVETIKIIFVGSISRKEKSFNLLLEALSKLTNKVSLNVYNYEQQENAISKIPENVQLILGDPLKEMKLREEFCKNDLLIVTSNHESFGLSLLEGMDTGILFISTDRVGLTERFPESFKRFVVPYGNVEKLKSKILELHYLDEGEKNKLVEEIRKFSLGFGWDNITNQYLNLYKETLGKNIDLIL